MFGESHELEGIHVTGINGDHFKIQINFCREWTYLYACGNLRSLNDSGITNQDKSIKLVNQFFKKSEMKSRYKSFIWPMAVFMIITSCDKSAVTPPAQVNTTSSPPFTALDREYFWGLSWQKTSNGYEMKIQTPRLTDSAINNGIKVGVAIYSDWSVFDVLPFTINDPSWLRDTINLSYIATPGKLQVFATTSVDITWASDVSILFK